MGRFKLGALEIPTFNFSLHFFFAESGPLPKNSGPNPGTFLILGRGYIGPLETSAPWPNPSYVPGGGAPSDRLVL